jgi:hypothetical protein
MYTTHGCAEAHTAIQSSEDIDIKQKGCRKSLLHIHIDIKTNQRFD